MTLLEVLTCIAVVALLISLLLPAIQRARESANRSACVNNLRQLVLATHACHDVTGKLPPYSTGQPGTKVFGGWWIHLLPYASESACYEEIQNASGDQKSGRGTVSTIVVTMPQFRGRRFGVLACASDPSLHSSEFGDGTTSYLANWYVFGDGVSGCYTPAQSLKTLRAGLSNGVLFAEGYSTCNGLTREAFIACGTHNFGITWNAKPSDDPSYLPSSYMMFQTMPPVHGGACDPLRSQTPHAQMPTAFADGSVRSTAREIAPATWSRLMKPRAETGPAGP